MPHRFPFPPRVDADPAHVAAWHALVHYLLVPAAAIAAHRLVLSSGYRTPSANALAGGKVNSQHLIGEAADLVVVCPGEDRLLASFAFVETVDASPLAYDQLIFEHPLRGGSPWVHLSLSSRKAQRREALTAWGPPTARRYARGLFPQPPT